MHRAPLRVDHRSGRCRLPKLWLVRTSAELNEAATLDRGDPEELGQDYGRLRSTPPRLCVVGGCCGTDREHIGAISRVFLAAG